MCKLNLFFSPRPGILSPLLPWPRPEIFFTDIEKCRLEKQEDFFEDYSRLMGEEEFGGICALGKEGTCRLEYGYLDF